jgi:outer membrane protein assembly factor BamB
LGGLFIKNRIIIKFNLVIILITTIILSLLTPITIGYNGSILYEEFIGENYYFDSFSLFGTFKMDRLVYKNFSNCDNIVIEKTGNTVESTHLLNGPANSAWPMIYHNLHHTARSPYTPDNSGIEKWRFRTDDCVEASPVIGDDGTIYIGDLDFFLYAINSNGTLKWKYETDMWIWSAPAVAEDGTIYVTSLDDYLHAVNPNGTLKWKYCAFASIVSSPAIGDDGTIYFGTMGSPKYGGCKIYAVTPNGTEKWYYQTGDMVISDPAIGDDGTIYIGSCDNYLYALYPNGTLRWRFGTGGWIKSHPSIADDGTIYFDSFDYYLYALYPDGTLRWKIKAASGCGSAAIGADGTIYICSYDGYLYAVYPNGTIKWSLSIGNTDHSSPAISADGTIYVCPGNNILAVDPNGSELWRKEIGTVKSSPAIGVDGTIYVGSEHDGFGYLHAFGAPCFTADADGPYYGIVGQSVQFKGKAYKGVKPYEWLWDFGDGYTSDEQNPAHIFLDAGNYTVILTVTDYEGNITNDSSWSWVQATNDPPDKPVIDGRKKGESHQHYQYTFNSTDPEENPIWYYVDWDDGSNSGWLGPYISGQQITITHTWDEAKVFIIKAKAKDVFNAESDWATFKVNLPKNRVLNNLLFLKLLEKFPLLQRLFYFSK